MRSRVRNLSALFVVLAAAVPAAPTSDAATKPSVEVAGITEVRSTQEPEPAGSEQSSAGLQISLRVAGLAKPARHGEVVVAEATDDAGTNLVPRPLSNGGEKPQEFEAEGGPATRPAFLAPVDLRLPARRARRIAVLKGELRLTAGREKKTVKVPGVKALRGKTVDHPELAQAGITVQVGQQGRFGSQELAVLFSGDGARDISVGVVDAAGESVSGSASGSPGKGSMGWLMNLSRPLQDSDTLHVSVPAGQEAVTVPFDLKDIALP